MRKGTSSATGIRRGVILFIVVIIVLMLTLLTYGFLVSMRTQNLAAAQAGDRIQARQAAFSARELACLILESSLSQRTSLGGIESNEALFARIQLSHNNENPGDENADELFSYGFVVSDFRGGNFGVENQSAKIDLNRLLLHDEQMPGFGRECLMRLPNMTESMADHILDWIDADDQPREFGAESDFYAEYSGILPRNSVPTSLAELTQIPDVTPELIDGQIAAEDSQFEAQGWSRFLTVLCAERNEDFNGQPRINLNGPDLFELHSRLAEVGSIEIANFVVLARQYGLENLASEIPGSTGVLFKSPTEIPVDFNIPAAHEFDSCLDIINGVIKIGSDENDSENTSHVQSPLNLSSGAFDDQMALFLDGTTVTDSKVLKGRVNLLWATREVLLSVPGLSEELADQIIGNRDKHRNQAKNSFWLLSDGLVNMEKMKQIEPFIGIRGEVCRLIAGGKSNDRFAPMIFDVRLDATNGTTRQISARRILESKQLSLLTPKEANR